MIIFAMNGIAVIGGRERARYYPVSQSLRVRERQIGSDVFKTWRPGAEAYQCLETARRLARPRLLSNLSSPISQPDQGVASMAVCARTRANL